MKSPSSIDLTEIKDKCFASFEGEGCSCLTEVPRECLAPGYPFYKPNGFKDWIRIEDRDGINLLPPEEYNEKGI